RVVETASDLPVILAMVSSFKDRSFASETVVFGEVGLAGEIRPVPNGEERIREAAKHGFKRVLLPRSNLPRKKMVDGIELIPVSRLQEALDYS
ncbi:MAG: DNA repair protein RadA, partial [Gammaproteobacteria bacterium]